MDIEPITVKIWESCGYKNKSDNWATFFYNLIGGLDSQIWINPDPKSNSSSVIMVCRLR